MNPVLYQLGLRELWRHRIRSLLAVASIAAGISLAVGVAVASHSASAASTALASELAGDLPVRVRGALGRGGVPDTLPATIAALPESGTVVPVVQAVAEVEHASGVREAVLALGVDCSVEELIGPIGCDPQLVSTGTDLAPFVSERLRAEAGAATLRTPAGLVDLAQAPTIAELDEINDGRLLVFGIAAARAQFERGDTYDAIYVAPAAGTTAAALRAAVDAQTGPSVVVEPSTATLPGAKGVDSLLVLLGLVGGIAALIGGLLVFNLARLSAAQRRRHLAIAAAVGVPGRLLQGAILLEAAVLGAAGGVFGALGGAAVARPVVEGLSSEFEESAGLSVAVRLPWSLMLVAVASGIGLAVTASIPVARRAAAVDPARDLHRGSVDTVDRPRLRSGWTIAAPLAVALAGVGCVGLANRDGGVTAGAPTFAYAAIGLTCAGFLLAVPGLSVALLRYGSGRLRGRSGLTRAALASVAADGRRMSLMAASLAAAVALSAGLGNFLPSTDAGLQASIGELVDGRLYVNTVPANTNSTLESMIDDDLVDRVAALDAVARVDRHFSMRVDTGDTRFVVAAFENLPSDYDLHSGSGSQETFGDGGVMLGPGAARTMGALVGDVIEIPVSGGVVERTVGGIWANPTDQGRNVTLSADDFAEVFGAQPAQAVFATPAEGLSGDAAALVLEALDEPALVVLSADDYVDAVASDISAFVRPFWILQRMLLVVAFLSTAILLTIYAVQTTRERAVLSAVGLTARQVMGLDVTRGLIFGGVGIVLGAVGSLVLTYALTASGGVLFGLSPPVVVSLPDSIVAVAVGTAVVIVASAAPALAATRTPILEGLRYE